MGLLVAVIVAGCTGSGSEGADPSERASSPSGSPSASIPSGITLRGWPTSDSTCNQPFAHLPKADSVRFDHVSRLTFCLPVRSPATAGVRASRGVPLTLTAEEPGFAQVMRELSAEDVKGTYACPAVPYPVKDRTLAVLATTSDAVYRVRLPAGVCGALQPGLMQAMERAHVEVGHVTTY